MNYFFLDASAWIKRFHQEPGTEVVNRLVDRLLAIPQRLAISPLGLAEVIAALNRYRNEGRLPPLLCRQATARLLLEAKGMDAQPMSEAIVIESLTYISQHNLNASDALYLRQMFLLRRLLQRAGHDLVLVAADRRLLRAATTEDFMTLDPEAASVSDVEVLVQADTDSEQDLSR